MDRMRKMELIREGVRRRRYFLENSGPEDVLDCGIHSGRKFEDVYLDHKSYVKWVLELEQPHMWSLRCFRYFLTRLMDLERTLKGARDQEQRMREERLEMSESLVEDMALEERNVVEEFKRVRWADAGSRHEQMAEKEEVVNRSETLTETQNDNDNETWQGGRQQQENTTQAEDDDDKARQGGQQEQEGTRQAAGNDGDETRQGGRQEQEDTRQTKQQSTTARGRQR